LAAIGWFKSCEACDPDAAEFPIDFDKVMLFSGTHTDDVMLTPACPNCKATTTEKTRRWRKARIKLDRIKPEDPLFLAD
jgi:hypothetical protein